MGKVVVMAISDSEEQILNKMLAALEGKLAIEYIPDTISDILTFPELKIHVRKQVVYQNHTLIPMSHNEFFTLLYLARHPGWVFSREQIYEALWKESGDGGAAVTNVVSQIRKKIGDRYIKTVIGSGYKFEV